MWNVICVEWQYGHSLFIRAGSQLQINGQEPIKSQTLGTFAHTRPAAWSETSIGKQLVAGPASRPTGLSQHYYALVRTVEAGLLVKGGSMIAYTNTFWKPLFYCYSSTWRSVSIIIFLDITFAHQSYNISKDGCSLLYVFFSQLSTITCIILVGCDVKAP